MPFSQSKVRFGYVYLLLSINYDVKFKFSQKFTQLLFLNSGILRPFWFVVYTLCIYAGLQSIQPL